MLINLLAIAFIFFMIILAFSVFVLVIRGEIEMSKKFMQLYKEDKEDGV